MDWDATKASLRGPTKFYFTYGDLDPLLPDIRTAEDYLKGFQFPVDDKVIAGVGHCAFDQVGRVAEVWNLAATAP